MLSYAKWKLLTESFAGPRTLGLGYPTNLGAVGSRATSEGRHKMKFMFGDDEGSGDMPFKPKKKKKGPPMDLGDHDDEEGADLDSELDGDDMGHGHDDHDMGDMGGHDMDDGDMDGGDDMDMPMPKKGKGKRMPPPQPDEMMRMMHAMKGMKGMGDDMGGDDMGGDDMGDGDMDMPMPKKKGKKGPPMDLGDDDHDMGGDMDLGDDDHDMGDDMDHGNMDDDKGDEKCDHCAKCARMMRMKRMKRMKQMKKEAAEPWTKEDADFLRSLRSQMGATQFKVNKDGWSEYQEDALLAPSDPNADVVDDDDEPGPGEVGYAPQSRVGRPLGGYEEWSSKHTGRKLNENLRPSSRAKRRSGGSWFGS